MSKEEIVVEILRSMPEGAEVTLKAINERAQYARLFDLFEVVQKHLHINFTIFNFVKQEPLEDSLIIRKFFR